MIATQDIAQEIYNATKRLDKVPAQLFKSAEEYAQANKKYVEALGREKERLKDEGMAIGLINDIAKSNIKEKLFDRDIAEFKYTAGRDAAKAISTQVNALQSILKIQSDI